MDSGFSEFFRQLPTGFVVIFCASAVLLIFAVVYIVRARTRRAQAAVPVPAPASASDMPAASAFDEASADLPDLDTLASSEVPKAAPRPSGAHSLKLTEGDSVDVVEVFSVLRDISDGGLIIRIGDKAYRHPPAVADADFKRRFHNTLRDLNGGQRSAETVEETEPVAADGAVEAPVQPPPPMPEIPRINPYEPAPGDLPKFRMPDTPVKPKRGQRPIAEPIPEINVAASIEVFLQHKLTLTPTYSKRSIHVSPALHGGVTIEVDGKFYESVGEVEDVAVRQFLSATIEEWQARQ